MKVYPAAQIIPQLQQVAGASTSEFLKALGQIASESGFSLYLLGGAVRDILLGRIPEDLDIFGTTSSKMILDSLLGAWSQLPKGTPAIANFKLHPDVGLAKLFFSKPLFADCYGMDLLGQDSAFRPLSEFEATRLREYPFLARVASAYATVAALAISLNTNDFGTLYDEFDGEGDIKKRELRLLDAKNRTPNDLPTLIKLIGLSVRIGFTIEGESKAALLRTITRGRFDPLSKRSLFARLCDVLNRSNQEAVIRELLDFHLGPHILPPYEKNEPNAISASSLVISGEVEERLRRIRDLNLKEELVPIGVYGIGPYAILALTGTSSEAIERVEKFYELENDVHGSLELCAEILTAT